jgi:polyisoprenoid-binding protein YceI
MILALLLLAAPQPWMIQGDEGFFGFSVPHWRVVTVHGQFTRFSGDALIDDAHPENSKLNVTIDTASVFTGNPTRDEHLRSADFFASARFPSATFTSQRVRREGDHLAVDGTLTLRGATHSLTLLVDPLSPEVRNADGARRRGVHATAHLSRHDLGLAWNKFGPDAVAMVGDDVALSIDLELLPVPQNTASGR